jgi:hypothetical protein
MKDGDETKIIICFYFKCEHAKKERERERERDFRLMDGNVLVL